MTLCRDCSPGGRSGADCQISTKRGTDGSQFGEEPAQPGVVWVAGRGQSQVADEAGELLLVFVGGLNGA